MHRSLRLFAAVALLLLSFGARAQLTIEIVGGAGTAIPIAIVPFGGEASFPLGISGIVGADLQRSGVFRLVNTEGVTPRPVRPVTPQAEGAPMYRSVRELSGTCRGTSRTAVTPGRREMRRTRSARTLTRNPLNTSV